jgi:cytoplasmic iron level regulating protein YaaA (DUF328/UPF0246 family)
MARIGLIACSASKLTEIAPAAELYTGDVFIKSREYVEATCNAYMILSAMWGAVRPDGLLAPYELYLPAQPKAARDWWNERVIDQLQTHLDPEDTLVVLAGAAYRAWVPRSPWGVETPLAGLGIGEQKAWLKRRNAEHALAA